MLPVLGAAPAAAAGACAAPGAAGAGGSLSGVVNTYLPGVGAAPAGATSISVGAPSGSVAAIAPGDLLLVIQMQAADIDSSNTGSYGHGGAPAAPAAGYTAINAAGLYEYVRATSAVTAGAVSVSGLGPGAGLVNGYSSAPATASAGQRTFQVVRVPQYTTATTSAALTAAAWDGSVGGVLALDTTGMLTLASTVSVDGLGFRGGTGIQRSGAGGFAATDVAVSATANVHGNKAEGVAGTPVGTAAADGYPGGDAARGAPGNAGGGGTDGNPGANNENSGGGGGGNGGTGGVGGNTWSSNLPLGGYGGAALPATGARVFLGGGGGAGTSNDGASPRSDGARGGGIVLIRAGSVDGTGSITANGANATNATRNDGGGGAGAGGTVVLTSPAGPLVGATLRADGGRGGDAWRTQAGAGAAHGPGGGGGGGWLLTSSAPGGASVAGGPNGLTTTGALTYGSAPGTVGQTATVAPAAIPGVSGGAECADLSITKIGPARVDAGATLAYQLSVANAGPAAATSVSVSDSLPAGVRFLSAAGTGWTCTNAGNATVTCTRASLASGATAPPITVAVTAPSAGATSVNTATVTATTPDPDPGDNAATATTTVTPLADLSIRKTGPASVPSGAAVSYRLAVTNAGPSGAASLSVTDTLPLDSRFVSATGTGWTCSSAGDISITCTRPGLADGTTAPRITVVVTAPTGARRLANRAVVSSSVEDPRPSDNTSTVFTTVGPVADLSLAKDGPADVDAGAEVRYRLVVANAGPDPATDVDVVDTLPEGVGLVSAVGRGWTCRHRASVTVTCTRSSLADGDSAPAITVVVTAPTSPGRLTNTAEVEAVTLDPRPGDNDADARTQVRRDDTGAGGSAGGGLVPTGADVITFGPLGLGMLTLGALLLVVARRRTR